MRPTPFSTVREDFIAICDRIFDGIAHDLFECSRSDRIFTKDAADCLYGQLENRYAEWGRLDWEDQRLLLDEWCEAQGEYIYE